MIDLNDLRARPDLYQMAADRKRVKINVHEFLILDARWREMLQKTEEMRAKKNSVSKRIPVMKGEEKETALGEMKVLSGTIKEVEEELTKLETAWNEMQLMLPNLPL